MAILFLDAYDSFSNNITALLTTLLHTRVDVLPIDAPLTRDAFRRQLRRYDAVVCGPGPGSPACAVDVGLMRWVWEDEEEGQPVIPCIGICLGFQSLVVAHGGAIQRLRGGGLHGMVRPVEAANDDIFKDIPPGFRATLYHSLTADIGQHDDTETDWRAGRWTPTSRCPDLVPLAWLGADDDDNNNDRILMAVRHRRLPFWGLQYHPESVCTDAASQAVLVRWFAAAQQWNAKHGRTGPDEDEGETRQARQATRPSLLSQAPADDCNGTHTKPWSHARGCQGVVSRTLPWPKHAEVPDLVEALCPSDASEHIILDSASADGTDGPAADATRGRFSIVALDVAAALQVAHHAGDGFATVRLADTTQTVPLRPGQSIWHLLAAFHDARRLPDDDRLPDVPFVGGFMGYVSYEQGLHDIGVHHDNNGDNGDSHRPDVCWVWVTRSLVVDHVAGRLHVQQLCSDTCLLDAAAAWADGVVQTLKSAGLPRVTAGVTKLPRTIRAPDAAAYEDKVRACQAHIAAGDSYELCLTDQTLIETRPPTASSPASSSWSLYRALRRRNPAPFASYLRLGGATLVSSSPERFLRFGYNSDSGDLVCSMRPMKGTVRRSAAVATRAQAEALLHVPKEEAENLMIVDLVRHDLHGVCGPGHVTVPALLVVEEHGHVFQMVSVVEGRLPADERAQRARNNGGENSERAQRARTTARTNSERARTQHTGIDVLAASLPPGSMTGAPKKRSCELLLAIEQGRARSLYSGVVGYVCASGRGDWSVTIRSLFRWDDETDAADSGRETWHVGAGGAVTILSTAAGERDEMVTKLAGPLGVFE